MALLKTQGTELYFINPLDGVLHNAGCVTSINGIDSTIDQVEVSCLNSAEREYIAGMGTPGTATFGIILDNASAVQELLYELKQAGETIQWAVGFSDGTDDPALATGGFAAPPTATRSWLTFSGFMNSFAFDIALNDAVRATVGIQISGAQTLTLMNVAP